jgi:hypothetical protein
MRVVGSSSGFAKLGVVRGSPVAGVPGCRRAEVLSAADPAADEVGRAVGSPSGGVGADGSAAGSRADLSDMAGVVIAAESTASPPTAGSATSRDLAPGVADETPAPRVAAASRAARLAAPAERW